MNLYQIDVYIDDSYFIKENEPPAIEEDKWRSWFEKWLSLVDHNLDSEKEYEISLILTDDQEIQQLNYQFRRKNQPTDVLAFAALEDEFPTTDTVDSIPLGDIIISVETAKKQAQTQKHSLSIELAWLASHGFLHLLGWDHPDDQSLIAMLTEQQKLLYGVGFDQLITI
jgi:probable rRNA maturation factor